MLEDVIGCTAERPPNRRAALEVNPGDTDIEGWTFGVYYTRFLELPRLRSLLLIAKLAPSSSAISDNATT